MSDPLLPPTPPRSYRPSARRALIARQLRDNLYDIGPAEEPTRERRVLPGSANQSLWALPQVAWIRRRTERLGEWNGIEIFRGNESDVGLGEGALFYLVRKARRRDDDGGFGERPEFPDTGERIGPLFVESFVGGRASGCVLVVRGNVSDEGVAPERDAPVG
jgi:hypothetical protein